MLIIFVLHHVDILNPLDYHKLELRRIYIQLSLSEIPGNAGGPRVYVPKARYLHDRRTHLPRPQRIYRGYRGLSGEEKSRLDTDRRISGQARLKATYDITSGIHYRTIFRWTKISPTKKFPTRPKCRHFCPAKCAIS